jgi:hypothetical protein
VKVANSVLWTMLLDSYTYVHTGIWGASAATCGAKTGVRYHDHLILVTYDFVAQPVDC